MKALLKRIYKFDNLSPKFSFENFGSSNNKNLIGAIYSGILFLVCGVIIVFFGQDFYLKTNPTVTSSQLVVEDSTIEFGSSLFFVVGFTENNALSEKAFQKYEIDVVISSIKVINQTVVIDRRIYKSPFVKCEEISNMTQQIETLFNFKSTAGIYCLNLTNIQFSNGFTEVPSSFISFRFFRCKTCDASGFAADQGDLISFQLLDSYLDHSNFTDPVQWKVTPKSVRVSDGLLKKLNFRFTKNVYESDQGWILNDIKIISHNFLLNTETDISLVNAVKGTSYPLLYAIFESPRLITKTTRIFMKIQDFCSNAGGFISAILLIVDLFTSGHLRFLHLIFLRDLALDLSSNESHFNFQIASSKKVLNNSHNLIKANNSSLSKIAVISNNKIQPTKSQNSNHYKDLKDCRAFRCTDIKNNNYVAEHSAELNREVGSPTQNLRKSLTIIGNNDESYFLYMWYFATCKRGKYYLYNKQIRNIEKLISISSYLKLVSIHNDELN